MNDDEFAEWNTVLRKRVISYLEDQGIESPSVGDWPAFEVAPHFGIWCVESKKVAEKIGWWVFAGDCPTDYVSESGKCNPRASLAELVVNWKGCIPDMKAGRQPSETNLGDGSNLEELGELLEKRVAILEKLLADDGLWEDR
jgi:hypothetical protein